jgi:hypothetical protein
MGVPITVDVTHFALCLFGRKSQKACPTNRRGFRFFDWLQAYN